MELNVTGARVFFEVPGLGLRITETEVVSWLVMAVIAALCYWLTRNLQVRGVSRRQVVAELLVKTASDFVKSNMGERFAGFAPFIASLFALSALSSLSSLLGLYPPTADLSTELGWALLVFVMITYYKVKSSGLGGYLKGFTQPIAVLTPFNIISEISTPISMAFRHFGNIASGTVITALVYGALASLSHLALSWVPAAFVREIPLFQLGLPAFLSIYFDLFSGLLQAFIFCMLTMMYVSAAAGESK
ncbi:F0F1 ATP synthase subunit A [Clostridiaceae bacterium NSJ-31]|uniref:ATP synthase subunit a n=1 Tax=Ligaoa zhengdingensis TaxID=2763658 RepID=A0A926DY43_9FIRM|nr:FoF1 ATP synthase subunit a [Ligaoa zhengdingensis]MBC8546946.1 F0F1 ATP synthase subunit A [Ligaoa zhengdingensis]